MNNKYIIAAAGSGKTTHLVDRAMEIKDGRVLITTYTENNADEIKNKFIREYKCVPNHVTIQTWFSFLIQHGVKPYQGTFNKSLFDVSIKGMIFANGTEGKHPQKRNGKVIYVPPKEETHFKDHYFSPTLKIYSDRLPKFVVKSNEASKSEVLRRISRIYKYVFIDEVQDLAGYDLEIVKLLFKSNSEILLVGDPRQVTYLTHHEQKHGKYLDGKLENFINDLCKKSTCEIDKKTLNKSHRNNKVICEFSSKLYCDYDATSSCECEKCRNYENRVEGIFLVSNNDVDAYLEKFKPVQLRWDINRKINENYPAFNFGESKGETFDDVLIYPTDGMEKWIFNNNQPLSNETRAKFYVAITRAKYSVGIITDNRELFPIEGVTYYSA